MKYYWIPALLAIVICIIVLFSMINNDNNTRYRNLDTKWQILNKACIKPRSYQIDVYDEGGTNNTIRVYDGNRYVGSINALDSSEINLLITKDNE